MKRWLYLFLMAFIFIYFPLQKALGQESESPATPSSESENKKETASETPPAQKQKEKKADTASEKKPRKKDEGPFLGRPQWLSPPGTDKLKSPKFTFSSGLGYERFYRDHALNLTLNFDIDAGMIGGGLWAPLRFMLKYDSASDKQRAHLGGVFRKEDWDEPAEFARIIRYLRFGQKGQKYYFRTGDLEEVTIGHGTIVSRYRNNLHLDHWQMGANAEVNSLYAGGNLMIGNFFRPYLFGGRAYIRPLSFYDKESYWNNLVVGFTVMTDLKAPSALKTSIGKSPIDTLPPSADFDNAPPETIKADDVLLPYSDKTESVTIIGGDIEFRVLNNHIFEIIPYIDINGIVNYGVGFHNGLLTNIAISELVRLKIALEYRLFDGDYMPEYFNTPYELQRYVYPGSSKNVRREFKQKLEEDKFVAKAEYLGMLDAPTRFGWLAEGAFAVLGWVNIGAAYDDYQGYGNSNLKLFFDMPRAWIFDISFRYYKFNFEKAAEVFQLDERALMLFDGKIDIYKGLFVNGKFWRTWKFDRRTEKYVPVDDWLAGLGYAIDF